jgi:hypothetical protein
MTSAEWGKETPNALSEVNAEECCDDVGMDER